MKKIDCIIYCLKIFYMSFCTQYLFFKLIDSKINNHKKHLIIFSIYYIIISFVCLVLRIMTNESIYSNLFLYFSLCVSLYFKFKKNIGYIMLANILSFVLYYIFYGISVSLVFVIQNIFSMKNKYLVIFTIIIIQQIEFKIFFRIKRFKNGFQFLNKKNNYLNIMLISISSIILYLFSLVSYNMELSSNDIVLFNGKSMTKYLYFNFFIFSIIMLIMIKESLTLSYKQKLLENTIADYENQIKEKDEKIKKLSDEKFKISKLNHEFHNRQEALMLKVENVLNNMKYETGEELDLKDKINSLSNQYNDKLKENKTDTNLPKTGIDEIDDMFTYMESECRKNDIEFILQINGNINYLINNYIEKNKLVTLIGDHLRDAIIAVNYSTNKYKSILAILGIKNDNYEFCVFDSGIEFQINTYDKLGIEPATTHKESGGTGIGFITTFETLNKTGASFEIEEFNEQRENYYTKSLKFIFDNKRNLKIISYRSDLLKSKLKSNRFKIFSKNTGKK